MCYTTIIATDNNMTSCKVVKYMTVVKEDSMFVNLLNLSTPEIRKKIMEELNISKFTLSKKMRGKYPCKEQFSDYEKERILNIFNKTLNRHYTKEELFKEIKEDEYIKNNSETNYASELAKRIDICIKLTKCRDNVKFDEICEKANISSSTLKNYRSGKTSPDINLLDDLAKALNVIPQYLTGQYDTPIPYKYKSEYNKYEIDNHTEVLSFLILIIWSRYKINKLMQIELLEYLKNNSSKYMDFLADMILSGFLETEKLDKTKNKEDVKQNRKKLIGYVQILNSSIIKDNDLKAQLYNVEKFHQEAISKKWLANSGYIPQNNNIDEMIEWAENVLEKGRYI